MCMDAKVTPTDDIDYSLSYSCHINHRAYSTDHIGTISHHTHTRIQRFVDRTNYKKTGMHQPIAGKHVAGLKI